MNHANIKKLRDFLAREEPNFHMLVWGPGVDLCGTPHCLGGYAAAMAKQDEIKTSCLLFGGVADIGAYWLGLTREQSLALFYMEFPDEPSYPDGDPPGQPRLDAFDTLPVKTRRKVAIWVLNHLLDTGKVDWFRGLCEVLKDKEERKQ